MHFINKTPAKPYLVGDHVIYDTIIVRALKYCLSICKSLIIGEYQLLGGNLRFSRLHNLDIS
ncbi:MAG: hypothetical protein ACJAUY_002415 [Cognaticolwellia sp.]|jgi:hypothetical protein